MYTILVILGICIVTGNYFTAAQGQDSNIQTALYGHKKYVEYQPGSVNSKLIITAPHGGFDQADDIPKRRYGCWDNANQVCSWSINCKVPDSKKCRVVTKNDAYTKDIAMYLRDEVEQLLGERPHLIMNNIFRSRLDPNRPVEEAAQHNADAIKAYEDFHALIKQARASIQGGGLLVDIHGQGHAENWVELGYLYRTSELDSGNVDPAQSSIRSLASSVNTPFWQLLNGPTSLGAYLEAEGYKVVPSPAHPTPRGGKYYRGGYITQMYGSRDGGQVDAIQIESPRSLRNANIAPVYSKALARAVSNFVQRYY